MANYVKTISVSLRLFGNEPSEKWNSAATAQALVWGSDYWGQGTVGLPIVFTKGIYNSFSVTGTVRKIPYKNNLNTVYTTFAIGRNFSHGITNTVASTSTVGLEVSKLISNDLANTSTVSREMTKVISVPLEMVTTINRNVTMLHSVSLGITTKPQYLYLYRGDYRTVVGDVDNAAEWTRSASMTSQARTSTVWTESTTSATTWS